MKIDANGLIYTKPSCIGCNSCILGCPVPEANIASSTADGNFLIVDSSKCIHCGHCMISCRHNSRDYLDDTDAFLDSLKNGEKMSIVVAPSFILRYPETYGKILNYFKSLGIEHFYDGGFGGTLNNWATLNFLDKHPQGGFAISECPVFVNYVEKHSLEGIQHLLPVQSSVMCVGIYIKKYFCDPAKLVFLGNCPARKDEFESASKEKIYTYNVTMRRLVERLDPSAYESFSNEIDLDLYFPSSLLFAYAGSGEGLADFIDKDKLILKVRGTRKFFKYVEDFRKNIISDENGPYLVNAYNCEHGCILGPPDDNNIMENLHIWETSSRALDKAREQTFGTVHRMTPQNEHEGRDYLKNALYSFLTYLDPDDFRRDFVDHYHQQYQIPEVIINEVFEYMHKYTEEERHIDCHSCGYGSCREMARSIALGINSRENCVYYEKYENQRLVMKDLFTGIPNMNSFIDRVTEILKRHEADRYAVASFSMIDNNLMYSRYGYDEVDKCIKEYSLIANSKVHEGELLARNGDVDYFAVIDRNRMDDFLLDMNLITVHPMVGRHEDDFVVNICAGVYQIADDDTVGDVLGKLGIAWRAANERKSPCCIYYDEGMKENTVEAAYFTKAFYDALKNREFVVYYQPKVDLKTMKLHGAEALVRWIHCGDFISPGRFIPTFENNGYVVHVDFYVLDQVCRDLRNWLDAGMNPVRVSSNFSKLHITSPDIVNQIVDVIDKYDLPHELIEVEFTETTAGSEKERLTQILRDLHEKGISTSIDDFGSGYSSLNMLQTMDFNVLKIDKGFLDSGIKDSKSRKIIGSIIRMAKELEMNVVAEGVEKYEELEFLRENNCDMIQGYYFDKPLPEEVYRKRLEEPVYELKNQ
ncbi:MAG: EAL domain-containing protein [Lachnospiraceae bacterium]|nr:EAL domain-containing protein [Lachnospiraceae bacterium]